MGLRFQAVDGFSERTDVVESHDSCLCRGLQKRMFRYSRVLCDFGDDSMRKRKVKESCRKRTAGGVMQPLLPYLLAACAPSAELVLDVQPTQGKAAAPTGHGMDDPYRALHGWPLVPHTVQRCSLPDVCLPSMRESRPDCLGATAVLQKLRLVSEPYSC